MNTTSHPRGAGGGLRSRLWYLYLALGAGGTAAYFFAPRIHGAGVLFNVLGISAAVAIVVGARLHRPERRFPWYLFAIAQVLFVTGDVMYYTLPEFLHYEVDFPSAGDIPYISVYPLIIAGLLLLIHARNPRRDRAALIDALIIGVGVGVVSWVYLMVPYARDEHLPLGTKALSIAYPLMDVLVLAVTTRIAVDAGRRAPAFYMLMIGLASLVVADSAYGFIELHGTYQTGSWLDIGWIAYYMSWGAAALHPSMRTLCEPAADPVSKLTRKRLMMLAAATLMAPLVQATKIQSNEWIDEGVLILASILLFLLVVARLRLVVRQHEEAEDRERALREAGAALVSAPTKAATYRAALDATRDLVERAADVLVCEVDALTGQIVEVGAAGGPVVGPVPVTLDDIPEEGGRRLLDGTTVTLTAPRAFAEALGLVPSTHLVLAPLAGQERLVGLLVVSSATALDRPLRDGITALASQVALALEAAGLSEDLHRRQSEARFRSLVQNSSDVVTVVATDGTIRYQSPSIEHIFGHDPAALVGTSLFDLLHSDDRARVAKVLGDVAEKRALRPQVVEARWRGYSGESRFVEMLWTDLTDDPNVGGVVLNTRDISERKAFEARLEHQAFHDPVTGLANRALFRDRVQHALDLQARNGKPLAVVFMDVDDFKTVNDSLGHSAGDQLLIEAGQRLKSAVRSSDTAARLGGDEFAVLLEDVRIDDAVSVGATILEAVKAPFTVEGREVFIRASLGIAASEPSGQEERRADDMLRDADVAMYIAKERGKGRYEVFEPSMHKTAVKRLELRADLQRALEHGEFRLDFQPIVELDTGRVSGVEALLRWQHPVLGQVAPADFIPLAEETGLIVPIGRWVIEEACRRASELQHAAGDASKLTMAVNLSARQLQHPGLIGEVSDAIASSGMDPSALVLEITESMMMRDSSLSTLRLRELKQLGIQIAVDDFGTAYSSLNYLCQFPLDVLKVDRSFVDRLDRSAGDHAVAEAIVHLARVLGLRAVAEGIETLGQLDALRRLGCGYGQGYYLARPMDAASVIAFIEKGGGRVGVPLHTGALVAA